MYHTEKPPKEQWFQAVFKSWMGDSNPRPHDYESGALPAELIQHTCPEGHVILPQVAGFVNSFLGGAVYRAVG